jgi:rare lipoprotein A
MAVRPTIDQPEPDRGTVRRYRWHRDDEVSWYGPGFIGNRTACGLTLTRRLVGVAHRTLPCGTRIAFRDPGTDRVVVAPVVDRGPYVAGRSWDLTYGLCKALDHCYTGPLDWRYVAPG